jgi:SAM-dependent methyltransferase/4-amino-4-deoxy-L-arabinose transferase-like glycosyltransferase
VAERAERRQYDDLLWRHLKSLPAFRALLRAVEARFYRAVEIPGPVLDLGCGDGHFAGMAFDEPLAAGVDPWWGPLQKAQRSGGYHLQVQALGDALPFAGGTFASVISNSVLEHIEDVQPVLAEASRVLQPGGLLVTTMPSHLFTENLAGARWFGDRYRRFFNTISRHAHTDPPEVWSTRLARAGFRVRRWQYYFSPDALHALEIGHVQGLPSAVLHFLTGHWILGPWQGSLQLTERWLRPYYEETPPETGAYLFFVAEKVASSAINTLLPAAQPFAVETLKRAGAAGTAAEPLPPAPPASTTEKLALAANEREQRATEGSPEGSPRRSRQVGLLVTALVFALLAQATLSGRPETPRAGVWLYLFALAALAALILERRAPGWLRVPRWQSLPTQRLLYPLALLVALLAAETGGATPYDGRPVLALLVWLLAISLGFYALHEPGWHPTAPRRLPHWRQLVLPVSLFILALLPRLVLLDTHPFVLSGVEASLGLDARAIASGQIGNPFATGWLTNPVLPLFAQAVPVSLLGSGTVAVRLISALIGAATIPLVYFAGRRLWSEVVGLSAALLMLGSHWHVHYSRLGMTNVWDPFFTLLAVTLILLALRRGTRRAWLFAGLASGANAYLYTSSHILPLLLAAFFLYLLVGSYRTLRAQAGHILAGAGLAAIVVLPLWRHYGQNPGVYMERANTLGVVQTGWLAGQATQTGESLVSFAGRQLAEAALAFNYSLDTSSLYNPGRPLLSFWPALLFVIGAGVALLRLRQPRYALLLIWTAVTVTFAGALLVDPPASHRLLIAAPAVSFLAALGLYEFARLVLAVLNRSAGAQRTLVVLGILSLLIAVADLSFYFGDYRTGYRFGDRNTEIAGGIAAYLQTLSAEETAVYFHGPPVMYVTFPTIPFLVPDFQAGLNLFDVEGPAAPIAVAAENLVFIYVPERSDELERTQMAYPGGEIIRFSGNLADPLFYAYAVQP